MAAGIVRQGIGLHGMRGDDHGPMTISCGAVPAGAAYVAGICNKVKPMLKKTLSAFLAIAALASPAAALEPLSEERYINDRLIAARIADRIRRECPTLGARIIYAYQQARALERYALDKGYSRAEVDAFLDSKTERRRIYAVAEDYMARNGVTKGDPQSYCRLGMQEIANRTVTGSLLVAK